MKKSRRDFLKLMGATGAGLLASVAPAAASSAPHVNNEEMGMLYDATKCVGCKACMATCKRVNGDYGSLAYEKAKFDPDGLWDAPTDLSGSTRTLIKLFKESDYSRFAGKLAKIQTRIPLQHQRVFKGRLKGLRDGSVAIELPQGNLMEIPLDVIQEARLEFEWPAAKE